MDFSVLFSKSRECVASRLADPDFSESVYLLIHLVSVWLVLAMAISPVLLYFYKRRIVSFMNNKAESEASIGDDALALVNLDPEDPTAPVGNGTQGMGSYTKMIERHRVFRNTIFLIVLVHLLMLGAVGAVAMWDDSGSVWSEAVASVELFILLVFWSTPVFTLASGSSRLAVWCWLIAIVLLPLGLYHEQTTTGDLSLLDTVVALAFILIVGAVLHVGISGRRMRNIVPYLTVALTVSTFFTFLFFELYSAYKCTQVNAGDIYLDIAVVVLGFFVSLLVVKTAIYQVASAYREKRISDRQIQISCWIIVVSLISMLLFQVDAEDSVAVKPIALLVPVLITISVISYLRFSKQEPAAQSPHRLLLLRVFATSNRGEKWLERVENLWRHLGPIYMIAGPDLAQSTADPHELYLFLTRKIRSLFITSKELALLRLNSVDDVPDPDGRYRINEFFCFDNIWEFAVNGLLARSDSIVLDLRDFELARIGTAKEVKFLADSEVFSRTLIIVDTQQMVTDCLVKIEQLTSIRISETQFVVAESLTPAQLIKRILELRQCELDELYSRSDTTDTINIQDANVQSALIIQKRREIVQNHQDKHYRFSYLVFIIGLLGMTSLLLLQFLAPLYLRILGVSWKRCFILAGVTILVAASMQLIEGSLGPTWINSEPNYESIAAVILMFAGWGVSWIWISRRVNRWIGESTEPLRSALCYFRQLD